MKFNIGFLDSTIVWKFNETKIETTKTSHIQNYEKINDVFCFKLRKHIHDYRSGIENEGQLFETNEYLQLNDAKGLLKLNFLFFDTKSKLVIYDSSKTDMERILKDYFEIDKQFINIDVPYNNLKQIETIKIIKTNGQQVSFFDENEDIGIINSDIESITENEVPESAEYIYKFRNGIVNQNSLNLLKEKVSNSSNMRMSVKGNDENGNILDDISGVLQRKIEILEEYKGFKAINELTLENILKEIGEKI